MLNSTRPIPTNGQCYSSELIATGVIVHDSNSEQSSWRTRLWKFLVHHLIEDNQPHAWQEYNRLGESIWRIYDPQTRCSAHCHTEAEAVNWLEQRMLTVNPKTTFPDSE